MNEHDADSPLQQQLRAMREQYAEQLPRKIEEIENVWGALCQGAWDADTCRTMHRLVHSLTGSGATFGFVAVSATARALETFIKSISGAQPDPAQQKQIHRLLADLKRSPNEWASAEPTTKPSKQQPSAALTRLQDERLIYLLSDDSALQRDLMRQLSYFGYTIRNFCQASELSQAISQLSPEPAAIMLDIQSPAQDSPDMQPIAALKWARDLQIPLLFISECDDLMAHLEAIRAGCQGYFVKPLDIGALIDTLDRLTSRQLSEPYRILIVDDEAALAEHNAAVLQAAGMRVVVVNDPLQVMRPLHEVKPDVILMDVYMPVCTGLELAAVIRHQSAFVSIPIVFLSSETNLGKQLDAMSLGGDEFLEKPIRPEHLLSAVTSRAQRSRVLHSLMARDSLTGLLNHTRTKEQLELELLRAQRQQTPLSFAMIDIDHFKLVNDSYGHALGDRVIVSLSRLLRQRLRKSDIIGRYGGEEFAVLFPNTKARSVVDVLNEMRETFAQVRQRDQDVEFTVTFSAGLADFPQHSSPASLSDAADQALYEAKRRGRNQVVCADAYGPDPIQLQPIRSGTKWL